MYPGEAITFTCRVDESSEWEYTWCHNGSEIQSPISTYSLPSVTHSSSGEYYCKAKRGPFFIDQSDSTILRVSGKHMLWHHQLKSKYIASSRASLRHRTYRQMQRHCPSWGCLKWGTKKYDAIKTNYW